MSEKHDSFLRVKVYPETVKAVKAEQDRRGTPPPSFTALVNALILLGIAATQKKK